MQLNQGLLFICNRPPVAKDLPVRMQHSGKIRGPLGQHVPNKLEIIVFLADLSKESLARHGVNLRFGPTLPAVICQCSAEPLRKIGMSSGPLQDPPQDLSCLVSSETKTRSQR